MYQPASWTLGFTPYQSFKSKGISGNYAAFAPYPFIIAPPGKPPEPATTCAFIPIESVS